MTRLTSHDVECRWAKAKGYGIIRNAVETKFILPDGEWGALENGTTDQELLDEIKELAR